MQNICIQLRFSLVMKLIFICSEMTLDKVFAALGHRKPHEMHQTSLHSPTVTIWYEISDHRKPHEMHQTSLHSPTVTICYEISENMIFGPHFLNSFYLKTITLLSLNNLVKLNMNALARTNDV